MTVLSKILRRVALPQGSTAYLYILFFNERVQPFRILFIGKMNGSLSHTSLKHWSFLTAVDEPSFEYEQITIKPECFHSHKYTC